MKKVEGGICTWEDSQHCMPFDEVVCQRCPKFKPEPSPEPSMPLIDLRKQIESIGHEWLDLPIGGKDLNAFITLIMRTITAHDQQVRKDFAEKCIKGMHILRNPYNPRIGNDHVRFDNTCAKQLKADIAHLRAMAGER